MNLQQCLKYMQIKHGINYSYVEFKFINQNSIYNWCANWNKNSLFKIIQEFNLMDDVISLQLFHHHSLNTVLVTVVVHTKIITLPMYTPVSLSELPWNLCSNSWLWHHLVFTWCECIICLEVFFPSLSSANGNGNSSS